MKPKVRIRLLETLAGHWYEICPEPDFMWYFPSSTTILEAFPRPGLDYWKTNTSPEEIREKQEGGKLQGTKTHHIANLMSMGHAVSAHGISDDQIRALGLSDKKLVNYLQEPLTERESRNLIGFENFWAEYEPITVGSEIQVYQYKRLPDGTYEGYAGTLDWVGYLKNSKTKKYELFILDWKTAKTTDRANDLQITSYHKALEFVLGRKIKARIGVVYLGNTTKKKFSLKEVKDEKKCWTLFQKTWDIWKDLHTDKKGKLAMPDFTVIQETYAVDTSFKKKGKMLKLKQDERDMQPVRKKSSTKDDGEIIPGEAPVTEVSEVDPVPPTEPEKRRLPL